MSLNETSPHLERNMYEIKKNSKYISGKVIEYIESSNVIGFKEKMRKGYEEMASINLELSQLALGYDSIEIYEYENWLCGE